MSEILFLLAMTALFFGLNAWDLGSWYYSLIGDEYPFYAMAKYFHLTKVTDLFSQRGVYGYHPVLSSFYQAVVIRLMGNDNFAWRMSSVLIVIFSLPGFYFLVKNLFGKRAALFSTLVFCFSFYFWGYAHTGYNNLQVIFPFIYSLWLVTEAQKKSNNFLFFLSGLVSGLGWYTFYTSRATFIFALLFIVFHRNAGCRRKFIFNSLSFFSGFLVSVFPLWWVSGREVISQTLYQSVLNQKWLGTYVDDPVKRWLTNFKLNLLGFLMGEKVKHFVAAPLLDIISRILVLLGFFKALKETKKANYFFILILYFLLIMVVAFNPIKEIAVSRMQLSVLILTIFAGLGWEYLDGKLKPGNSRIFLNFFLAALLFLVNFNIFFLEIPRKYRVPKEALIIKIAQESTGKVVVYEGRLPNVMFREIVDSYHLSGKIDFLNDQTQAYPALPFFYFDNSKGTPSAVLGITTSGLPCQRSKPVEVESFLPGNNITGLYCY